ncbi:MAG: arylesterase [Gemmatimonadetes bacterium]|nr:arylesterase [Gemmatimonadota bacterium]
MGNLEGVKRPDRGGRSPVLFVGTSLTAGLGLDPDSAFPARVERLADEINWRIDAQNAGLSGETSAGTLRRMEWLLTQPAEYIILETGANDGLRGLNVDSTRKNIESILRKIREVRPLAKVFLVQMEAPPNMGAEYTKQFHDMYGEIAQSAKVRLLPFLLQDVAGKPELNQADGIHPNDKGEAIVAKNLFKAWGPMVIPGLSVK